MILDSFYLATEKIYINKYNSFVESLNNNRVDCNSIFDMKPRNTSFKYEMAAMMFEAFTSISIYGFYLIFIAISIFSII